MQIGMVGLGRMGANMTQRLVRGGVKCAAYDVNPAACKALEPIGVVAANTLEELVRALAPPRAVWMMVPAGDITERTAQTLIGLLGPDDTLIDGGNSYFKDDVRRAAVARVRGIHYVDAGTSGGVWGLERGYCLMVGGEREVVQRLDPIFRTLAPGRGTVEPTPGRAVGASTADEGYLHCGPVGAGHFVKMIHNGIEYGLMQAYGEGFNILANASSEKLPQELRYDLPIADIAELWRRGSVVSSWLLDLTAIALAEDETLSQYTGYVEDSGEGRWTVQAAMDEAVPADVLATSVFTRFRSRQEHVFAEKILSAMRDQFGGHKEKSGSKADAI